MLKLRNLLLASLIISNLPSPTLGWDCTAHQVIQHIALSRLNEKVERKDFVGWGRSLKSELGLYDELRMACFMDDVRSKPSYDFTRPWHFIDQYFSLDGSPVPKQSDEPDLKTSGNVLAQIQIITGEIKKRLSGKADPKSNVPTSELVAYLVHLVGDAHQPLHCAILVSDRYPKGDAGGNRVQLSLPRKSLHAYWDQAGGLFETSDSAPNLKRVSKGGIQGYADKIVADYPATSLDWQNMDPAAWVQESYDIARKEVYAGIKAGEAVSKDYQTKTQKICSQRLAMAGYRLGALLNTLFSGTKELAPRRR
jgi:hypothetical protein